MKSIIEIPLNIIAEQDVAVPNGGILLEVRFNNSNQLCLYVFGIQGKATHDVHICLYQPGTEITDNCNTFLGSVLQNGTLYFAMTQ